MWWVKFHWFIVILIEFKSLPSLKALFILS